MLGGAFHGLVAILGPVTQALGAVAHFLSGNSFGHGAVTAVLALWTAYKGFSVITGALGALSRFRAGLSMTMATEREMQTASYAAGIKFAGAYNMLGKAALTTGAKISQAGWVAWRLVSRSVR